MKNINISLIICTRDRGLSIKKCLESISPQEMIEVNGELIVVNNGSTDNTADIIENFKHRSPFPIINVLEPKAGLSNARNSGVIASSGRIIAFTDDDCYPQPDLLREAIVAFDSNRFSYCGGRILLYDNTDAKFACNYEEVFKLIPPSVFSVQEKFRVQIW